MTKQQLFCFVVTSLFWQLTNFANAHQQTDVCKCVESSRSSPPIEPQLTYTYVAMCCIEQFPGYCWTQPFEGTGDTPAAAQTQASNNCIANSGYVVGLYPQGQEPPSGACSCVGRVVATHTQPIMHTTCCPSPKREAKPAGCLRRLLNRFRRCR